MRGWSELNESYATLVMGWELFERGRHGNIYHNGTVTFVDAKDWCELLGREFVGLMVVAATPEKKSRSEVS